MANLLDGADITLTCSSCHKQFKEKIGRLKASPTVNCPGCHKPIKVEASGLASGLKSVDKSLADLQRALGKIGKG